MENLYVVSITDAEGFVLSRFIVRPTPSNMPSEFKNVYSLAAMNEVIAREADAGEPIMPMGGRLLIEPLEFDILAATGALVQVS